MFIVPESKIFQIATFKQGKVHGDYMIFDGAHMVVITGKMIMGKREGEMRSKFSDGTIETTSFTAGEEI